MADNTDTVTVEGSGGRYVENPDFVPDPTNQFGTLDTSGTAGAAHARIEEVTPVFQVARQQDLKTAARALDPDDDGVDSSMVVLSTGTTVVHGDPEADKARVLALADAAEKVDVLAPRPGEQEAAEEGEGAVLSAQAQQQNAGAGSPGGVSTDTERQKGSKTAKDDAKS